MKTIKIEVPAGIECVGRKGARFMLNLAGVAAETVVEILRDGAGRRVSVAAGQTAGIYDASSAADRGARSQELCDQMLADGWPRGRQGTDEFLVRAIRAATRQPKLAVRAAMAAYADMDADERTRIAREADADRELARAAVSKADLLALLRASQ